MISFIIILYLLYIFILYCFCFYLYLNLLMLNMLKYIKFMQEINVFCYQALTYRKIIFALLNKLIEIVSGCLKLVRTLSL